MALDAILLSGIIAELRPKIIGARIDKVQQPERDKIVSPSAAAKTCACSLTQEPAAADCSRRK